MTKAARTYIKVLKDKFPSAKILKENKDSVTISILRGRAQYYNVLLKASALLSESYLKHNKLPIIKVVD